MSITTIEWKQTATFNFVSADGNFQISPEPNGKWRLRSTQKGKFYIYTSLDQAFEGARNIAEFYAPADENEAPFTPEYPGREADNPYEW